MILAHLPSGYVLARLAGQPRGLPLMATLALPLIRRFAPRYLLPAALFLAAVLLHLVLDTLAGSIMWLWPLSDRLYALVEVPATRSHWVLSFLTHWSALAELALILWAAVLFLRRPKPAVKA